MDGYLRTPSDVGSSPLQEILPSDGQLHMFPAQRVSEVDASGLCLQRDGSLR